MKKALLLSAVFVVLGLIARAQFQNDLRLTSDAGESVTSPNNTWCIAADGNNVHVVWRDNRDGNYEVYYKQSADGGATWGADVRLTSDINSSMEPCIAVSGQVVHVAWQDDRDGNDQIYYKRSADGGATWGADMRMITTASEATQPCMAASGNNVCIVWQDWRDSNYEIYFMISTDGGATWGAENRLTNTTPDSEYPSVAISGNAIHVTWQETVSGYYAIMYMNSQNGGSMWSGVMQLTNSSDDSQSPCIAASGNMVSLTWYDLRDGNEEIYYKRSADGGTTWGTDTRLTNDAGKSYRSNIAAIGQFVHLVWIDNRDGNTEVYYKKSADYGVSWGADTRLTNDPANSWRASVTLSGPAVHVVWEDTRDVDYNIYYKKDPTGSVGMEEKGLPGRGISLLPNPASATLHLVSGNPPAADAWLAIINSAGKKVYEKQVRGSETTLDVSSFPEGIYLVMLSEAGITTGTGKLIVKR